MQRDNNQFRYFGILIVIWFWSANQYAGAGQQD